MKVASTGRVGEQSGGCEGMITGVLLCTVGTEELKNMRGGKVINAEDSQGRSKKKL